MSTTSEPRPLSHTIIIGGGIAAVALAVTAAGFAAVMFVVVATRNGKTQKTESAPVASSPSNGGHEWIDSVVPSLAAPSVRTEGETWTLNDLRDYMTGKILQFTAYEGRKKDQYWKPGEFDQWLQAAISVDTDGVYFATHDDVHVGHRASAKEAKESAGSAVIHDPEVSSYSWGRFEFYGSKKQIEKIKKALAS